MENMVKDLDDSWARFLNNSVDEELNLTARTSEIDVPSDVSAFASPLEASTPKGKTLGKKARPLFSQHLVSPSTSKQKSKKRVQAPKKPSTCTCTHCAKVFKTNAGLLRHERIHQLTGKLHQMT
jgi:hypothetical protein